MQTVLDRKTIENTEKEKHNAMINERYRRLLDAVEDQMSAPTETKQSYAPVYAPETPAYDSIPVVEQTPTVTEYAPSTLAAPLFTTEKFQRFHAEQEREQVVSVPQTQVRTQTGTAVSAEVRYSLTPLAKIAMAVFTLVVVAMLVLIGVNSQIIQRKSVRLKNLEEQKQELQERNEEIQRYLQELQTEESIIQRATEAGLLNP